jgi:hypothetical protein
VPVCVKDDGVHEVRVRINCSRSKRELAAYIEAAVRMVVVPAASAGLVYVPPISQADQLPPGTP